MFNYSERDEAELEFVPVSPADELAEGERLLVEIDGEPLAVYLLAGKYYALADVCSHDDGPVAEGDVEGTEIACPRHGARFSLETGKALSLPAVVDIPAYPVRVAEGQIWVGVPVKS